MTTMNSSLSGDSKDLLGQLVKTLVDAAGTDQVIEWLQEAAQDDDSFVRANAITSLGTFDDTRFDIASSLREALDDPDGIVRVAAFSEIVKQTSEIGDLTRLLREALKDDDPQVRAIALDELAEREIEGVHPVLIESALSDSDAHVRNVAAIKLRASLESTINRLSRVMQQEDVDRRVAAIKTLGTLGQNFRIGGIRGEPLDEEKKEPVSDALARGLNDSDERVRLEALKALRYVGYFKPDERVKELLLQMAWNDESVNVRQEAAQQLQYMDGGFNVLFKPIFDFTNDRDQYPRLIKLIGENEPFLPNDGYLYTVRGSLYEELQNFDKALDDYERALELNYDAAWLRSRCAMVCSRLGRHGEAVKAALKAVEFAPCNASAHLDLGWYTYTTGDYEKSIEESRIALGLDPSAAMAAFNLGLACVAAHRLEEAGAAYDEALKISSETEGSKTIIEAALKDIDELLIAKPELTPDADQFKSKLSSVLT
jgi:tetratricopeptide (TPR) repeat protein